MKKEKKQSGNVEKRIDMCRPEPTTDRGIKRSRSRTQNMENAQKGNFNKDKADHADEAR